MLQRIQLRLSGSRRFWTCLRETYPGVVCALNHKNAWELTVATILSAQCTDVRVNLVTPALFKAFPTPKAMAAASLPELEELIRTTGFFRNKAKSIQGAARVVTEEFGGKVPQTMEEILTVAGGGAEDGECCAGVVVWDCGGRGGRYACDAVVAAAGVDQGDGSGESGAGSDEDHSAGTVDRISRMS